MTSPLTTLSPDAKTYVLSFLPLSDCLAYGQVCRQALPEILPSLNQRRDQQFADRHAYQLSNPQRLVPVQDIPSLTEEQQQPLVQPQSGQDQWHVLPSVSERMEGLYRALPHSYSGKELARELLLDVQGKGDDEQDNTDDSPPQLWGDHFHGAMDQLRLLLKAHKLHDKLLSKATWNSRPSDRSNPYRLALTIPLEEYMGDVLVATVLMGHQIARLVEGPTTYEKWTQALVGKLSSGAEQQDGSMGPVHGYRQWVYLHSTLLRVLPMKPEWLVCMKLTPPCGLQGKVVPQANNDTEEDGGMDYILPPSPFWAAQETTTTLKELGGPLLRQRWCHSTRLDDFGPLGPAFRGRDRVRTLTLGAGNLLRHLGTFSSLFSNAPNSAEMEYSPFYETWLQSSETETSWMLHLSQQCYTNRPMTVQPPMVTISPRFD